MAVPQMTSKSPGQLALAFLWIALGAFLAAVSIRIFLYPNDLIDGGIIGIALILSRLFGDKIMSVALLVLNLPFVYLAFRFIRKNFVLYMLSAVILFAIFLFALQWAPPFKGGSFEIIVIGGGILGIGAGLIIRNGGCLDGTEILAIIMNRKLGFTVGQVVLVINVFIFAAYGLIFLDWEIALDSLLTYIVAFKMMDIVIVGLEELKSVTIITSIPKKLSKIITTEMCLGLTVMYGRGGYTGEDREILRVIVERLDLAELKEIVLREDPDAFMEVENLHEVVYNSSRGKKSSFKKKNRKKHLISK
ncbi:MAG: YitT family protein [Chlamydiia bacterium]|nr:YitT family protein [Chlamydiia bacterium]